VEITLGARDFSCAVSGVDHVSIVTRAKYFRLLRAIKNLWYPGYVELGLNSTRSLRSSHQLAREHYNLCVISLISMSNFN